MPHHKSCKKRLKQNRKENAYNKHYKSMMKTAIKKVVESKTKEAASENMLFAQSILDKLVSKGVLKKNQSSNKKSKMMKFVNAMK